MIQTCALVSNVLINALRDWPKYLNMELAACLTVEAGWDKYNKKELMYLGQFDNIIGRGNTCGKKVNISHLIWFIFIFVTVIE